LDTPGTSTYLALVFLIVCSAFFSASETALSTFNKVRMQNLAEKGDRKATLALNLSEQYDKMLSTILIGNNIVNIALSTIGTLLFVNLLQDPDKGAAVATAVCTVVVLIFGEITPKSIAKDNPERFASFSAPLLHLLMVVLTPINFIFSLWKKLVSLIFKNENDNKMSQEELLLLVEEVQQEGSIDETEGELLRNAIEFRDQVAEDILTHRTDLTESTIKANARFFSEGEVMPTAALTMGIGTILRAKKIIILANGEAKADAIATLLSGKLTTACPASFLNLHDDVVVICDRAAMSRAQV
jgi:Mg2+/Co2+ transporter CorB